MATRKSQSLSISISLHVVVVALLGAFHTQVLRRSEPIFLRTAPTKLVFDPARPHLGAGADSMGGANAAKTPPRRGVPLPKLVRLFLPPQTRPEPKFAMPLAVDFDVSTPAMVATLIGDPLGKVGGDSLGTDGLRGIGARGCCGHVGEGQGSIRGEGSAGHRISPPQLLYKVEPEFSEEARKAKFQGTVVLSVQVDASGKPSHLIVVSSPGLGLEAKAIDAVARWLFLPAYRDGKPFVTTARIEVSFHLL